MTEPLKIVILGRDPDVFSTSGAANDTHERHVRYVRELQRRRPGSEVRVIVHTIGRGEKAEEPIPGMQVHGTQARHRLTCPLGVARLMRSFHRDGWVPDVISCQTGYEEGPIALALRRKRSRVQIQIHNDFYGDAFATERPIQYLQRAIIRWAIRRCDQARVVSRGIARDLVASGDIERERIALAPVPIVFEADPPQRQPSTPVVLFVGRLVSQKDLDLWCEAALRVHHTVPAAEFWIVGDGPDREIIARRRADFGGKLRQFGATPYAELAPLYARASVFLLTSAYEGLGRVVVEAMLAGVPVVSTDIVGPQDLIEDGRTGRLVTRDAGELAKAVIDLLADAGQSSRIADAALQWALANYDFDAVAARLVSSWEEAVTLPRRML